MCGESRTLQPHNWWLCLSTFLTRQLPVCLLSIIVHLVPHFGGHCHHPLAPADDWLTVWCQTIDRSPANNAIQPFKHQVLAFVHHTRYDREQTCVQGHLCPWQWLLQLSRDYPSAAFANSLKMASMAVVWLFFWFIHFWRPQTFKATGNSLINVGHHAVVYVSWVTGRFICLDPPHSGGGNEMVRFVCALSRTTETVKSFVPHSSASSIHMFIIFSAFDWFNSIRRRLTRCNWFQLNFN